MQSAVTIPVTVKCRIGVDDVDRYDDLVNFIETVSRTGCDHFIIHARKALLKGLSPKENRTVPPLHYDRVYQLKQDFPELAITINGGVTDHAAIESHLTQVDGVMLGRVAYHQPYLLAEVDQRYYGSSDPISSREQMIRDYYPYIEAQLSKGVNLYAMTRHMLHLYHGQPKARHWRRILTEQARERHAGIEVIERALQSVKVDGLA